NIDSATRIRFNVPPQNAPGRRTLSILTRGGVVQREFRIVPKRLDEIFDGEITTLAGGVPFLGDNGSALAASFKFPQSVAVDGAGNILIADTTNNRIRRIDASGLITTIVGNGAGSFSGDGGPAISAGLSNPRGIVLDSAGNLFITDAGNGRIRKVDAVTGLISTFAGNGGRGSSGDGGPAVNASILPSLGGGVAAAPARPLFSPGQKRHPRRAG